MKGGKLWALHFFAGFVLFFLLFAHISLMHFSAGAVAPLSDPSNPLSWQSVLARSKDLMMTVIYTLFAGFGLYHGFYGLFGILTEVNALKPYRKAIGVLLTLLGVLLFAYGAFAAWYGYFTLRG
ncbi:MAG: hypothetical protein GXO29_01320 [Thermotogae bacterium]|nr:hypothetical protein [Thermotogota bacterium]